MPRDGVVACRSVDDEEVVIARQVQRVDCTGDGTVGSRRSIGSVHYEGMLFARI